MSAARVNPGRRDDDPAGQEDVRKSLAARFLTCGSVDDGGSTTTLIGRHHSYDYTKMIYEDHDWRADRYERRSTRIGSHRDRRGGTSSISHLLTDGLKAEREQGITIDVAYRYFSTAKRKFIIADTPGHEQYTRNMATGASTCRSGDHPHRRPQRRADADQAAQRSSSRCWASSTSSSRSTRWTSSTSIRRSSRRSSASTRLRVAARPAGWALPAAFGARRGTTSSPPARGWRGTPARR